MVNDENITADNENNDMEAVANEGSVNLKEAIANQDKNILKESSSVTDTAEAVIEQPDITPLKNAIDTLNKKWAEISQNIYSQSQKEEGSNSKDKSQKDNGKDNVEDADFEVVDD